MGVGLPESGWRSLIFANYAKKQLEVKENLPGLYKYSDWLPVCRTLDGSGAPVTYKVKGWPANWIVGFVYHF